MFLIATLYRAKVLRSVRIKIASRREAVISVEHVIDGEVFYS